MDTSQVSEIRIDMLHYSESTGLVPYPDTPAGKCGESSDEDSSSSSESDDKEWRLQYTRTDSGGHETAAGRCTHDCRRRPRPSWFPRRRSSGVGGRPQPARRARATTAAARAVHQQRMWVEQPNAGRNRTGLAAYPRSPAGPTRSEGAFLRPSLLPVRPATKIRAAKERAAANAPRARNAADEKPEMAADVSADMKGGHSRKCQPPRKPPNATAAKATSRQEGRGSRDDGKEGVHRRHHPATRCCSPVSTSSGGLDLDVTLYKGAKSGGSAIRL
ncbi:hypothetical protein HPB47_019635 [Ixodes persulcatus]|uniref:Uncharacterized protein n=1 Tax=Ixodes persulcatus TaxID=34615 RepID=A0AC60QHW1_IXOPE|nr:hypothetical protein HPB47_019635 [Ixodes persulcatus]